MQKEAKKEVKKTPIAEYETKEDRSWFGEYVTAVKNGFLRAWRWKFLWFWGILLPSGGFSVFSNFSGYRDDELDDIIGSGGAEITQDLIAFWESYQEKIIKFLVIAAIIIFAINLIFWVLGAIARLGVIKSLSEIQEKGKPGKANWKEVWRKGKVGFERLILLDIFFGAIVLIFLAIWLAPFLVMIFSGTEDSKLFSLSLIISIPLFILTLFLLTFLLTYLSRIATVRIALANQSFIKAIKDAWVIFSRKFSEVLKLFLIGILKNVVVFMVVIIPLIILILIFLFLMFLFGYWIYNLGDYSFARMAFPISLIAVLLLIAFLFSVLFKGFMALWNWDIVVWWVKRNSGAKIKTSVKKEAFFRGAKEVNSSTNGLSAPASASGILKSEKNKA